MSLKKYLIFSAGWLLLAYTSASHHHHPNRTALSFLRSSKDPSLNKPRLLDTFFTTNLLRAAMTAAQAMQNPCNLFESVWDNLQVTFRKTQSKSANMRHVITGQLLREMALPALREGISLHRTLFVLQETANLTVFLDQNRDDTYANTVLGNYSHYYIRAGNIEITQILFIGLVHNADLTSRGHELPALELLSSHGLANHPRQYVEFDTITTDEATMILEKRQQMAALLASQGLFWENDEDYITDLLSIAFNGPENSGEFQEMLSKIAKFFNHRLLTTDQSVNDKYAGICPAWQEDSQYREAQLVL